MYHLADPRLKAAAEKFGIDTTLKCRTLYQLHLLHRQGLVTKAVGEAAEKIIEKDCPRELIELIAPTID